MMTSDKAPGIENLFDDQVEARHQYPRCVRQKTHKKQLERTESPNELATRIVKIANTLVHSVSRPSSCSA